MQKILNISTQSEIYHIYIKNNCVYNCLTEEQFNQIWPELNNMVGVIHTDYLKSDLSYEKVKVSKEQIKDSSY